MSLHRDFEGLVVPERRHRHVVPARPEFVLEGGEEFLSPIGRSEGGAEVGVRIQHDAPGSHLARDVLDVRDRGFRGANRIRLIPFLRTDEADEGFFGTSMARLLRKIREALDGLLLHLVLEVVDMEEQDAHLARVIRRGYKAPAPLILKYPGRDGVSNVRAAGLASPDR